MIVETNKNTSTGKYEVDIKTNGVVAELEANKEVSIDVSNYSEPVEITPSSGKDGMEKATITLTNISSGGGGGAATATATAYGWNVGSSFYYLSVDIAPANITKARNMKRFSDAGNNQIIVSSLPPFDTYTRISDTEFEFYMEGSSVVTYTRDSSKDFTLWETN